MILDSENIKPFLDCQLPLVGMVVPTAKYTDESTCVVSPDGTPLYVTGEESLLVWRWDSWRQQDLSDGWQGEFDHGTVRTDCRYPSIEAWESIEQLSRPLYMYICNVWCIAQRSTKLNWLRYQQTLIRICFWSLGFDCIVLVRNITFALSRTG